MTWRHLSDPALQDFVPVRRDGVVALVRRGYEPYAELLGVEGSVPAGEASARASGRVAHPVVALPDGERALVRAYHRGGAMARVNRDRYFLGHRSLDELRVTEHARRRGVRVPLVLAAVHRRESVGYRALLATRWIEGAVPLVEWLAEAGGRAEAGLRAAGSEIAAMHGAGIDHPDLNLRNLVVVANAGEEVEVHLLDFDRARLVGRPAPPPLRARNLRRLARSARKLRAPIGEAGWRALRDGYGDGWPAGVSLHQDGAR